MQGRDCSSPPLYQLETALPAKTAQGLFFALRRRGPADASHHGTVKCWPEVEQMQRIPDVFDIPEPIRGKPAPWLAALTMTVIVIGATLALVVANQAPRDEPQVTVSR
jgi:hypothetical protein